MGELEGCAKAGGLLLHVLDQIGTLDALGPAGKILDQRGDGELASGFVALENQRVEPGASGVDGGGESGAAGAKNNCVANIGHVFPDFTLAEGSPSVVWCLIQI